MYNAAYAFIEKKWKDNDLFQFRKQFQMCIIRSEMVMESR